MTDELVNMCPTVPPHHSTQSHDTTPGGGGGGGSGKRKYLRGLKISLFSTNQVDFDLFQQLEMLQIFS